MSQKHIYRYTPYDEVERLSVMNTSGTEVYWESYGYDPLTRLLSTALIPDIGSGKLPKGKK